MTSEHPHRILEYSPTGRSACRGKCKQQIGEGALRFGVKVEIHRGEDTWSSLSFRCMRCITHRQAVNFFSACDETKHTPKEFLTVPPPQVRFDFDSIFFIGAAR